jgi:ATP-dependent RNA helicase DDX41
LPFGVSNPPGRTGRCGKTGVATTLINTKQCSETILLDLKHLLK